ncbi:cupin -type [Trichoderma arundinaceum]|uniref:Cupin-type n=1 Tax=Trichoderma arundinaceum TaxID=490622 RepID=A0A395NSX8_TRIAR|nr:cupin -type [Trichoderma arundinaceum]
MSVTAPSNAWLRAQRKSDLVELADSVGLKNYDGLKKTDLESALDDFIAGNSNRFSSRSDLSGYFNSRSKALGSPVKRESREPVKEELKEGLKSAKRRVTKAAEELISTDADDVRAASTALIQTPARSLSQVAARIPLPATPADVANAVDRSTLAVRRRVSSIYHESGINEASNATRETLSNVNSILLCVSAFELWYIRPEVLANRYAFTVPAVGFLGTSDYPVYLPDMFLLLTASFWSPALTWAFTSFILPSLFGYFFNLSATSGSHGGPKTRSRASAPSETVVDPLTYSIIKALVSFVVYGQGVTFCGLLSDTAIERLNGAVYGGYKGVLTGTAITGLLSIYDAVLKK